MSALSILLLVLAAIPAALFLRNVGLYLPLPNPSRRPSPRVSVLIPARDEEHNIRDAVSSALANQGAEIEVIVVDDGSEDRTGAIVQELAAVDPRVRLVETPPLPPGWNGKQHACHALAREATMPLLCFVDADVRLSSDALARMAAFLDQSGASLISGLPSQEMGSWMEGLLIPLIHFVLLGFLPMNRMRRSTDAAYSAGCGQLMMVRACDYHAVGGHSAIRSSLHDGIKLPRAFRMAGFRTDLFDATNVATCRMYHNAGEVWNGLAKNATEGMATLSRLPIFTVLLFGGEVLPCILLLWSAIVGKSVMLSLVVATLLGYLPRIVALGRFRQPWWSCLLHPVGTALLLLIQWFALGRKLLGKPASWRGRQYGIQST